jgi:hypothetical protein
MKYKIVLILIALFVCSSYAQRQKLAQTGFKFLSLNYDARISAMGASSVALEGNSTSLFYNPASMANINNMVSIAFGQYNAIVDFKYQYLSFAFAPENGLYGVFGISYVGADYGTFKATSRADNVQGYIDIGEFSPENYAIGFGYAKSLSDKFSVGGQIKYGYQNLSGGPIQFGTGGSFDVNEYDVSVFAYDFGLLYKTGYKSIVLGMYLRNFSAEKKYIKEKFQLPLVFEIGISADLNEFFDIDKEDHSFLLAIDRTHPRDSFEAMNLGIEYSFRKTFFVRTGIVTPSDEEGLSMGLGFAQAVFGVNVEIDYAYTNFGVFGDVQRFGFNIAY